MRLIWLNDTALALLAILAFSSTVVAQEGRVRTKAPAFEARGAFVALVVTDFEASLRWYRANLGLHLLRRARSPRVAAESAVLQGHNFFVELIHFDAANEVKPTEGSDSILPRGLAKVGVLVGAKDFESLAKHLQNQKVEFLGGIFEDKEMSVRTFLVKDNSCNRIQFFARIVRDAPATDLKPFLTFGIFIGKIEEGARIFTPVRLLPFQHPDAFNHQFPNALQLQEGEYQTLVLAGEKVGLKLGTTLQRYPQPPTPTWNYPEFEVAPWEDVKRAKIKRLKATSSPIPGLRVVVYRKRFPICFIVDTRHLTLKQRNMKRATSMGLDMTRGEFLAGLARASTFIPDKDTWILVFE